MHLFLQLNSFQKVLQWKYYDRQFLMTTRL